MRNSDECPEMFKNVDRVFDNPGQAKLLAVWTWIALEGTEFLEEKGEDAHAREMRDAIKKLISLSTDIVGREALIAEMDAISESFKSVH